MFISSSGKYIYIFYDKSTSVCDITVILKRFSFRADDSVEGNIVISTSLVSITIPKGIFKIPDSGEIISYIKDNLSDFVSNALKPSNSKAYNVSLKHLNDKILGNMCLALSSVNCNLTDGKVSITHTDGYVYGVYDIHSKSVKYTKIVSDDTVIIPSKDLQKLIDLAKMNISVYEWKSLEGVSDLDKILSHCANKGV